MDRPVGQPPLVGFVVVLVAASLFGMLGPLSRFAYDAGMEPLGLVAWRAFLATLATAGFVAWRIARGRSTLVRFRDLDGRARVALGAAAIAAFTLNLAMFIAFDRITVALALLGFYTYPAMVAVAAVALGRERLDRPKSLALGLALLGMILVVASQLDPAAGLRLDVLGFGLALGAALSQTVFVTLGRDGYAAVPTDQAMTVVLATTVALSAALALATGAGAMLAFPLGRPDVLPLLAFSGLFSAAIPSLCFLAGIRIIGGMRAGILMLFEPVVGVALAAWLLAEALQPIQVVGGGAILAAALILQRATGSLDATGVDAVRVQAETRSLRAPGGP
jgi:drug/metabolite transporter (DMT)-like permease